MSEARRQQNIRVALSRTCSAELLAMADQIVSPHNSPSAVKLRKQGAAVGTLADDFILMREVADELSCQIDSLLTALKGLLGVTDLIGHLDEQLGLWNTSGQMLIHHDQKKDCAAAVIAAKETFATYSPCQGEGGD